MTSNIYPEWTAEAVQSLAKKCGAEISDEQAEVVASKCYSTTEWQSEADVIFLICEAVGFRGDRND
ncbi:MAG: hypothetical protein ACRCYP_01625 [Alphaproteobacteria bacterium]